MNLSCKANETKNSCYIANIEARLIYFIFYYIKDGDDKAFERAGTTRYNLIKEKTKKEGCFLWRDCTNVAHNMAQ